MKALDRRVYKTATKKQRKQRWHLDPADVIDGWMGSISKTPAGKWRNGLTMTMTHVPTGVKVEGKTPQRRYSRPEMQKARRELRVRLFAELEEKVARELRIPGR